MYFGLGCKLFTTRIPTFIASLLHLMLSDCLNAGLEKVWDLKPLVNGKDIMNVLQLKVGGPLVSEWVGCIFSCTSSPPLSFQNFTC